MSSKLLTNTAEQSISKWFAFGIIAFFLLVYIVPLGVRPIAIPDETRYGEIPREMLSSGDWIVPHLNGLRYFEKPVLGYWLNGISLYLFGENAFAIRLPSAAAAGISALFLFLLIKKTTRNYLAGILSAFVLLSCMEFFIIGTFGVLDSVFSMFLTGTFVMLFLAYAEQNRRSKFFYLITAGIFCGLAFLTKGFLAFILISGVLVPFLIWERQTRSLLKIILVPVLLALLVALPWCVLIYRREPDFWNYFFWVEHIKRFMSGSAQHHKPFWFFIPILIGGTMPWTVLVVVVIKGIKQIGLKDPLIRFGICWFAFCFIFFSASNGKLATYILPCFVPLALLITLGILKYFETGQKKNFEDAVKLSAVLAAIIACIVILNQIIRFPKITLYEPGEKLHCVAGLVSLAAWCSFSVLAAKAADFRKKVLYYCFAPVLLMVCAPIVMPDLLEDKMSPDEILAKHSQQVQPNKIVVSDCCLVQAVCWFYKRTDLYCLGNGEFEYGLRYNDSSNRLLNVNKFKDLISSSNKESIILITTAREFKKMQKFIPQPDFVDIDSDAGVVFAEFKSAAAKKSV